MRKEDSSSFAVKGIDVNRDELFKGFAAVRLEKWEGVCAVICVAKFAKRFRSRWLAAKWSKWLRLFATRKPGLVEPQ